MKTFCDQDRYNYDLKPSSRVIDAGGYEGNFTKIIAEKYGCGVHLFEPIPRFMDVIWNRILQSITGGDIRPVLAALGGNTRDGVFHVQGDSSGIFAGAPETVTAKIIAIDEVLAWPIFERGCALLKLNVEGMEFEILERLLDPSVKPLLLKVRNIQVQFHPIVPEYGQRYAKIHDGLLETHRLTWCEPWCWENYELK